MSNMGIECRDIAYEVEGRRFVGFLADGSGAQRTPGVLVAHEGRGFTRHAKDRAVMLAELGYVAFAPDYFGEPARSLEHAFELMNVYIVSPALYAAHGRQALNILRAHPKVDGNRLAAIGFCWGGFAVLELACSEDLRCVVGFHPGLSLCPLSNASNISAKVLICVGDRDPHVPAKDRESFIAQMNDAGVDCQVLLLLGAPHSFTNPEPYPYPIDATGVGYNAAADRRSWIAMRSLFAEAL
ncbi:MAG TPA: dienelactone hydrolase family protein [Steroidobacteraceae bacterium]|nr:dienelactone hydrolase family protein [Steroidobacteraceae bacterium]